MLQTPRTKFPNGRGLKSAGLFFWGTRGYVKKPWALSRRGHRAQNSQVVKMLDPPAPVIDLVASLVTWRV
jgi:hypothetical protein